MVWHKHRNKKWLKKLTDFLNVLHTSPSVRCNQYYSMWCCLVYFSQGLLLIHFEDVSNPVPVMFSVLSEWMLLILQVRAVREEVKLWKTTQQNNTCPLKLLMAKHTNCGIFYVSESTYLSCESFQWCDRRSAVDRTDVTLDCMAMGSILDSSAPVKAWPSHRSTNQRSTVYKSQNCLDYSRTFAFHDVHRQQEASECTVTFIKPKRSGTLAQREEKKMCACWEQRINNITGDLSVQYRSWSCRE